jgi:hypothetical protein
MGLLFRRTPILRAGLEGQVRLPNSSKPLDNFPLTRTDSIEVVQATLARAYSEPELIPQGGAKALNAAFNARPIDRVRLYYGRYGADVMLKFSETNTYLQLFPLAGKGELAIGGKTIPLAPGKTAIVSSNVSWQFRCSADYEHLTLHIGAEVLTRKLAAMTGATIGGPLVLDAAQDITDPKTRILPDYLRSLVDTLNKADPGAALPTWWASQTETLLMTMVLCCNRHNYTYLLDALAADGAPAEVRRAEDFIEANWQRPLALDEIAAAAEGNTLSLFRAFKKYRGCSPLQYLAQVRSRSGKNS